MSNDSIFNLTQSIGRRNLLKIGAIGAATVAMPSILRAQTSELHVASLFDLTGNLNIYGIQQMNVSRYAIEAINNAGGVLGKKIVLHEYDTQSKIELYSRYAQEIGASDEISAVVGCFTGASREAARPVLSRNKKLLFFPTIDEGGECDKYCFMQGTDCVQQEGPLISWAIKNAGKKIYVIAADYIYGHVATAWTKALAEKEGGQVVGAEFIPLDVSDFSATIRRIQAAKPDVIMSNLVGNNHVAFYRQFAAAGMKKDAQIVSPVFGLGSEETVLTPEEGEGIVVAYSYFEGLQTPENAAFLAGFKAKFPSAGVVADTPAQVWNAWHQWKVAVEMAGSTEIDDVVAALEKAAPFAGPAGETKLDPSSHRNIQNVHLARVTNKQSYEIIEKFEAVAPTREVIGAGSCDLVGKDSRAHKMINPKF
ncbi:transporter substrate-binding protein [Ochrobactrum sp. CGA5]|uniref:transporter substrate-binding protein n=1 Tax=Ochrobactrum sp. CGA5 TaxID=2583453 RepID=UPI00111CA878|nr:transporter substrate-binding protein [Ochrobactrum sp. CGA5]